MWDDDELDELVKKLVKGVTVAKEQAGMGFRSNEGGEQKKRIKRPKSEIVYAHKFKNLIPGDVAIAIERTLQDMHLEFEEISTFRRAGPYASEDVEVPFIRYNVDGIEIPFGTYRVADLGDIGMNIEPHGIPCIDVRGVLLGKEAKTKWQEFLARTAENAKKQSIFMGKAVRIEDKEDLLVPKKMDLSKNLPAIFNDDVADEIATTIFWPLQNRAACFEDGICTKRGAILEGHYGSGKSLLLYQAAQAAHSSGWGVVNVRADMVDAALAIAPMLEPVCVIIEDADAGIHGHRDYLNKILNAVSSVSTKGRGDYMLLCSTNFVDRIDPAMLRPERIDAVIKIELPNRGTIEKLIRTFANGKLPADVPLDKATELLDGSTPAIISEVVQRALIDRRRANATHLTEESIIFHTGRMEKQKALAVPKFVHATTADKLAESLHSVTQYGG